MKKEPAYTENKFNAQVNFNQPGDEPKSAHASPVAETYVKERRNKAENQAQEERKSDSLWGAIKYVIL